MTDATGSDLLSGPRGRRVCLCLLASTEPQLRALVSRAETGRGGSGIIAALTDVVSCASERLFERAELALMTALLESVDAARYWQEPDETDRLLADPRVRAALAPIAEAVAASPETAWWMTPLDRERQRYVQWLDETPMDPPALTGSAALLEQWRARTFADELQSRERPHPLTENVSGYWWSAPQLVPLVTTTRALPTLAAVRLALVEDSFGWQQARVWPLRPASDARVFEITGPDAWAELAGRYPLDVSLSRRHDWWRATGHEGSWLIPDWAAVASDFDAVHLTVFGYLATAGRAVAAGNSHTVLAGWNPDETHWLTDVLAESGAPTDWHRESSAPLDWIAV
ncbi:hypothetical protein [Parafrigoribacterium soli]|uniref:hypothetical protein n=1 Tax=Parafrigoribacterium soli TaxID=3144663 RepID=UPI0032F0941C